MKEATPEQIVALLTGASVNSPCINCAEYQAALREIERLQTVCQHYESEIKRLQTKLTAISRILAYKVSDIS